MLLNYHVTLPFSVSKYMKIAVAVRTICPELSHDSVIRQESNSLSIAINLRTTIRNKTF